MESIEIIKREGDNKKSENNLEKKIKKKYLRRLFHEKKN